MEADPTSPDTESARPAHRPSRRGEIVETAIGVFADAGYASASVEDIATAAGLTPAALYYHFDSKDELFHEVLQTVYDRFSAAVRAPRRGLDHDIPVDVLSEVIHAGWAHWRTNPEQARLVSRYAAGPTPRARALRHELEQRHVDGAYDYVQPGPDRRSGSKQGRDEHASRTLRMRAVVELSLSSQAAAVPGGPLADYDLDDVVDAVVDTCVNLVIGAPATSPIQ